MTRYLVIGDVHGCSAELQALLDVVGEPDRQLVFVGDLVSKGPDSKGVCAIARARNALGVRGNHDEKALRWHDAGRDLAEALPDWLTLTEEDWTYLAALPYYLRLPDAGAIVVHAGLVPGVALEDQDPVDLITMRTLLGDGSASKHLSEGVPWASRWDGPELVVFGHDAITGLQKRPSSIGLDTGCVYGGFLTGLKLPEVELVSVPSVRAHAAARRLVDDAGAEAEPLP